MFDLNSATAIHDFAVTLVDTRDGGKHIELTSATGGRLAGFPAWDHADRDLRHFVPSDVPFGSIDEPFDDRDEGWRIVIFEDGGWVYIAEGRDPASDTFDSFVRVRRDDYFRAWAIVIDRFNPIMRLDDLFEESQ